MAVYTFQLRDGSHRIDDEIALPDRECAFEYARTVVHELMRCREQQTRTWRLDVYEDKGARLFEIPFVRFDETLVQLAPKAQQTMEDLCDRCRSLNEVMSAASVTMRESRALVARSRGKPYLAAAFGQRTIRGNW
jgi:hypothetical protein